MARLRKSLLTKQPVKALCIVSAFILTAARLPFWLICFIPARFRQHPKWTYRQAIMNELLRRFLLCISQVQMRTTIRLDEEDRFVPISPSRDQIYKKLLQDLKIRPTVTGGTWCPSLYKPGDEEIVVIHFHGGGYAIGEGRPPDIDFCASMFVKHLNAKVLFPSYRLASNEGCHFPAALQDAVTAYQYLLDQGIPSTRIVVSGDSAGGSLAVSLSRYISDSENVLPEPLAVLLWSPWLDLEWALDPAFDMRTNRNYRTDYLPGSLASWGARAYIPDDMETSNPYFSQNKHPFLTNTPLWIHLGGLEVLYDEGMEFADVMGNKGNRVEVHVDPFANHDILYVGYLTGFAKEAGKAVEVAKEFLSTCVKK